MTLMKSKPRKPMSERNSILSLVGGSAAAQVISFIFAPIQTRIFSPEVFGDLAVFTSIAGIIGIVACLRYELSIVIPQDDLAGYGLLRLSWLFSGGTAIATALVFFVFRSPIFLALGSERLAVFWYFIPITIALSGWVQASTNWLIRRARFGDLALINVLLVIVNNFVSLGLGVLGYRDLNARLFSALLSSGASVIVLVLLIRSDLPRPSTKRPSAIHLIKEYKNYLLYDIWAALINNLSWMLVPILMNYYYGSLAAGQYSIGLRVIQIPMSLIGSSVSQVFFKSANDRREKGELYKYSLKTARQLLLYTSPFAVVLMLFGKPLFRLAFGPEWEIAGLYVQILAPWSIVWFIANPLSALYNVLQKQRTILVLTLLNLVTRFFSLYVGALYHDESIGLMLFSASGCLIYGLVLGIALVAAKRQDHLMAQKD